MQTQAQTNFGADPSLADGKKTRILMVAGDVGLLLGGGAAPSLPNTAGFSRRAKPNKPKDCTGHRFKQKLSHLKE